MPIPVYVYGLVALFGGPALILYLRKRQGADVHLRDFFHAVEQLAPIVLPLTGVPPALVPFVIHGVQTAEKIQGASGADKLAAAVELTNNGIAALNTVKPGSIDAAAVNDAVVGGINATIAAVNAVKSTKKPDAPTGPTA